jgi:hypothetical protein
MSASSFLTQIAMFEIDGSHISALNDTDLRVLVARLCEAELRQRGLPVSAVTAGGDQNAKDGGIDVRVDLPGSVAITGFIPRPATGFQVKVSDLSAGDVMDEMCPKGFLRPSIEKLASLSGAYIIISSKSNTADSALQGRKTAMRDTLGSLPNADALFTDFYDRDRLARWVRNHAGVVSWMRERIGQPIKGWRPYANWANSSESLDANYLLDGKSRIYDWRIKQTGPLSVENGINRIREALAQPKGAVRLIGLSGTGKTRLVQALFDERVGRQSLDPTLAVYTDLGDQPDPSPRDLVRHLVENRLHAIVVVDNCPPETHRALVKICSAPESSVSLITVEYDVRDYDDPESTEVFLLEPASDDVIDHILEHQAPQLSLLDRRRIMRFSNGNARVALALAHTVRRGDSVANLSDRDLFNRLFHQRRPEDEGLLKAAEACTIVYSFNGEIIDGKEAELPFLAEISELSVRQFYRCVTELCVRGLIQRRGQWRALLPQALANMLAKQALESMPQSTILSFFEAKASERLQKSFSRRLGYLHDSEAAVRIVNSWLSSGGMLSELHRLNDLGLTMLCNVAPVAPAAVLDAIEWTVNSEYGPSFLDGIQYHRNTWTSMLRSIAYEDNFFHRSAILLSRFVAARPPDDRNNSAWEKFTSLFQLYASGTHALIDKRLEVVDVLLSSNDERTQACGIDALSSSLEGTHFRPPHELEFGARPRDYGWAPQNDEEVVSWYSEAISYASRLAFSDHPLSDKILSILADKFQGIWSDARALSPLELMVKAVSKRVYWPEGWIAVRNTLHNESKDMLPEHLNRLRALEEILRPSNLLQKARAYIFSEPCGSLDVATSEQDGGDNNETVALNRVFEIARELGRELARNMEVLEQLLPELVIEQKKTNRVMQFGEGLATGAESLEAMWSFLVDAIAAMAVEKRNILVLMGFLSAANERDKETASRFLDSALDDPVLGPWFPILQMSFGIDQRGAERIEKSLELGLAPSWAYRSLWHHWSDSVSTAVLRRMIRGIASLPEGYSFAVEVLSMWLHKHQKSEHLNDKEISLSGRELIDKFIFERADRDGGHRLGEIINRCFPGDDAVQHTIDFCRNIKTAVREYRFYPFTSWHLFESLFRTQPFIALDEFVGDGQVNARSIIKEIAMHGRNPLNVVPIDALIRWAQVDSPLRFPKLAAAVDFVMKSPDQGFVFADVASKILHHAPDRLDILKIFGSNFESYSWRSSLSGTDITLEKLRAVPQAFFNDLDPQVGAWAQECDKKLANLAEKERASERRKDESFE